MLNVCLHSKLEHDDRYIASINYICKAISNTRRYKWNRLELEFAQIRCCLVLDRMDFYVPLAIGHAATDPYECNAWWTCTAITMTFIFTIHTLFVLTSTKSPALLLIGELADFIVVNHIESNIGINRIFLHFFELAFCPGESCDWIVNTIYNATQMRIYGFYSLLALLWALVFS